MEKFNNILGALGAGIKNDQKCPASNNACADTDTDVGEYGKINSEESTGDKVIIHLEGGIEIHLPIELAETIKQALSDE
jgi:hypothetical protein